MSGFTEREVPELPDNPNSGDFSIVGNGSFGSLVVSGISTLSNTITGITTIGLGTTSFPSNSQLTFELTSNTNLRVKVRGTDGVLRSANITLA